MKKDMNPTSKMATLWVLMAGCLWGTMGIFVRIFETMNLTSMQMVQIRSSITAVLGILVVLLWKPSMLKIRVKDAWCFIGTGIFSMVFFNFCYFSAIQKLDISVAAALLYTAPVFVCLLSNFLFGERITRRHVVCMGLVLLGCVLVSNIRLNETNWSIIGVVLGIGAGIGYAFYSVFSRYALQKGYHPVTIILYTFIFACVGGAFFVDPISLVPLVLSPNTGLLCILYALATTLLPYFFYTTGLTYLENSRASMLAAIEPVTAAFLGIICFKEIPSVLEFGGIILILVGIKILNAAKTESSSS